MMPRAGYSGSSGPRPPRCVHRLEVISPISDFLIRIPMRGSATSPNASNAVASAVSIDLADPDEADSRDHAFSRPWIPSVTVAMLATWASIVNGSIDGRISNAGPGQVRMFIARRSSTSRP